jgi:hypothetical protein
MTFSNNSDQKERRAVLKNDATTYLGHTHSDLGGRFAATAPLNVTGASPISYPKLPASSPWSCDPVPPEEPLGIDVSETPVVGEYAEVQASLDRDFGLKRSLRDGVDTLASGASSPPDDVATSPVTAAAPSSLSEPDDDLGEVPHVSEGQHSAGNGDRQTRMLPQNIRRRLR